MRLPVSGSAYLIHHPGRSLRWNTAPPSGRTVRRFGARFDASGQAFAAGIDTQMQDAKGSIAKAMRLSDARRPFARLLEDFECTHRSPHVIRMDLGGGFGVVFEEPSMQTFGVALLGGTGLFVFESLAQRRIDVFRLDQSVKESANIEAGAAGQEDDAVAGVNRCGGCAGVFRVAPRAVRFVGVDDIEEMMWNTNAVLGRGLGCSDVHVPIDLHRIGIDDLALESIREFDRKRGLPGSSRTRDDHNGRQMRRSGLVVRARRFFGGVVVHGAADPSSPFENAPNARRMPERWLRLASSEAGFEIFVTNQDRHGSAMRTRWRPRDRVESCENGALFRFR